ncbi:unnamed protein product [Camellia sinensis]
MGRGKFKGKPTGRRQFSTPEEMKIAGTSARPRTFKQAEAKEEEEERSEEESEEESDEKPERKGTQGVIEIENPNLVKPKNLKARDVDIEKTTELSRREREEIEKQKAHERYMRLQEQGKTEQAKKDLDSGWPLYDNKELRLLKNEKKKKLPENRRKSKLANDQ